MENHQENMERLVKFVTDEFVIKKSNLQDQLATEFGDLNLNHFWHKTKFAKFWGVDVMHTNRYHEEKHGDAKFLLADNLEFKSRHDENGIFEGSPKVKDLGNDFVTDFYMLKPSTTLDLTWMKSKDGFRLRDSLQYRKLQNILVNVDNLVESRLNTYSDRYETNVDLNLNLVINNFRYKTKLGPKEQIAAIRDFFEAQDELAGNYHVKHVTLDGFSQTMSGVIGSYLEEKGISMSKRKHLTIDGNVQALKLEKSVNDLGTEFDRL